LGLDAFDEWVFMNPWQNSFILRWAISSSMSKNLGILLLCNDVRCRVFSHCQWSLCLIWFTTLSILRITTISITVTWTFVSRASQAWPEVFIATLVTFLIWHARRLSTTRLLLLFGYHRLAPLNHTRSTSEAHSQ
jgi:hypothetical protein